MESKILCKKEVSLLGQKYVVYLKEVATRVSSGGKPINTKIRAFVKRVH